MWGVLALSQQAGMHAPIRREKHMSGRPQKATLFKTSLNMNRLYYYISCMGWELLFYRELATKQTVPSTHIVIGCPFREGKTTAS